MRASTFYCVKSDNSCFDYLSSETRTKAQHWSKNIWLHLDLWSLLPALHNPYLLLVYSLVVGLVYQEKNS